jgi:G3E family GTPase
VSQVPEGDERTISNLLLDQIEFADVILLNKTDLLTQQQQQQLTTAAAAGKGSKQKIRSSSAKAAAAACSGSGSGNVLVKQLVGMLQELNPRAQVVPTSRCDVELQEVLLTGRFDMEQVGCYNMCYNGLVTALSPVAMQCAQRADSSAAAAALEGI